MHCKANPRHIEKRPTIMCLETRQMWSKKENNTQERENVKIVKENRFAIYSAITSKLNEVGLNVATITVQQSLHGLGIRSRKPAKKPKLTNTQRKKSLDWTKKFVVSLLVTGKLL